MTITLLTDGILGSLQVGFSTRVAAIAALPNMATGTVFLVGNLSFIKDGGSSIPDMPGAAPASLFQADVEHFRSGTTTTANDAAMTAAVAWLNAADYRHLSAAGVYTISAPLPAITGRGKWLRFASATLTMTGGANGKFIAVGVTGGAQPINFQADFGDLNVGSTCPGNDVAIDVVSCVVARIHVNRTNNLGTLLRVGGPAAGDKAQLLHFYCGGGASAINGGDSDQIILVRNATNCKIEAEYNCGIPGNLNANGALVRIKGIPGGIVDTIHLIACHMQMFSANYQTTPNGRPYGLDVDMTECKATNIWVENGTHFDHTTNKAVWVHDAVGSTDDARVLNLQGLARIDVDAGEGIVIEKLSPSTVTWASFDLGCGRYSSAGSGDIVRIAGAGMRACHLSDASLVGFNAAKARAIAIGSDGWSVTGNTIGQNNSGASLISAGIEVTNAAVTDLYIAGNQCAPDIPAEIIVPTFTTPDASAPRRNISRPGHVSTRTLSFADHAANIVAVTSGVIPAGEHSVIRINITAGATVTDITSSLGGLPVYTLVNINTGAVTLTHNNGKLRNNSKANIVLGQHESVTYLRTAPGSTAWQQIGGKA